ncbi:MAG: iron ABC transporter permease [Burkholderiales bacterium]|nr:iron ABC transporter permease [Phycisphaerae bacterium]
MRRSTAWTLFTLLIAFFALTFLWPLGRIVQRGFFDNAGNFTLTYLAEVFKNPVYVEGLINSLKIAAGTTTLVILIAVPLAWLSNRYSFAGKGIFQGLLLVPMILPPFVGAIGFQQMFGQYGAVNALFNLGAVDWIGQGQYFGVILLQALSLYPILYLNVAAALANIDPAMEQAASNLGCTGYAKFRRITLPLIMPGMFAGGTIVFIWSFTELGTPLIMQYNRTTPVQVFNELKDIGTSSFPYALVFVMLVASVLLYVLGKFVFGGRAYAMQSKAATASTVIRVTGWRAVAVPAAFAMVCFVALLPHMGVVLTSFSAAGSWYQTILPQEFTTANYQEALGHSMTVSSIRNSLLFASLAVLFNLVIGIAVAFVVVRSDIPFRGVLDALAMLPLAVPGIVMAFGYLAISSWAANIPMVKESAFLKSLFDVRTNPTLFLVIAYAVRRLPYMVRSAVAGLQQTSETLEEASANLGASGFTTIRRITVPLILANLIAGAMLAFAFSMLEVSDSLMLAQRADYFPITKTIYELFQLIGTGKYLASALGVWAMVFLAATILGASAILGKKMGAIFRV